MAENKSLTAPKQQIGTPFPKGVSGNPNGRPKESYSLTHALKVMMSNDPELRFKIGEKVAQLALKGDVGAIKLLWSYMDGMPAQRQDISVTQVAPILGGQTLPDAIEGEVVSEEPKQIE